MNVIITRTMIRCILLSVLVLGVVAFAFRGIFHQPAIDPWQKIEMDLQDLDADGLRGPVDGKVAVAYEFAIPNTEECKAQVRAIDSTVQFTPGSPGRIRVPKTGCLCIGSTHQPGYREVLAKLAALSVVERIVECHFE